MAYFKTHYYGGIRKYQWVTIPLQLRGVVALKSGDAVPVVIGEGAEPKLVITDLLPHLGAEQNRKPLGEAIPAETLNILLGSRPIGDADDKERVKLAVMDRLHEKYGITEDDFVSAELEAVPAADATDIGIDASLIGAYGHDDRVCAYAALQALFDLPRIPERPAVCMLADKEEIGSMGVTGMQSAAFDTFMQDLCEGMQTPLRVCYEQSFCLSADVTAAYDPNFDSVYEKRNAARVNHGLCLCKYTGARQERLVRRRRRDGGLCPPRARRRECRLADQRDGQGRRGRRRHGRAVHVQPQHHHTRCGRPGAEHARPVRDGRQARLL